MSEPMLPTLREELERKTLATLEGLETKRIAEEITQGEFDAAWLALSDTVMGLVSAELTAILSIPAIKHDAECSLQKEGDPRQLIARHRVDAPNVVVDVRSDKLPYYRRIEVAKYAGAHAPNRARKAYAAYIDRMIKKGWQVITRCE